MTTGNDWVDHPRRRSLTRAVYARDTYCWFCGGWVDQSLPRGHPMSRTAHHLIELQDGGPIDDLDHLVLAHRSCNSSAGAARAAERHRQHRQPITVIAIDPTTI